MWSDADSGWAKCARCDETYRIAVAVPPSPPLAPSRPAAPPREGTRLVVLDARPQHAETEPYRESTAPSGRRLALLERPSRAEIMGGLLTALTAGFAVLVTRELLTTLLVAGVFAASFLAMGLRRVAAWPRSIALGLDADGVWVERGGGARQRLGRPRRLLLRTMPSDPRTELELVLFADADREVVLARGHEAPIRRVHESLADALGLRPRPVAKSRVAAQPGAPAPAEAEDDEAISTRGDAKRARDRG